MSDSGRSDVRGKEGGCGPRRGHSSGHVTCKGTRLCPSDLARGHALCRAPAGGHGGRDESITKREYARHNGRGRGTRAMSSKNEMDTVQVLDAFGELIAAVAALAAQVPAKTFSAIPGGIRPSEEATEKYETVVLPVPRSGGTDVSGPLQIFRGFARGL